MIDNVEEGQKITAKKQNDIIDAVNSKWIGSTSNNGIDTGYKSKSTSTPEFLRCQLTYSMMLEQRPFQFKLPLKSYYGVKIHLGASAEEAKNAVKIDGEAVDEILIISKDYDGLDCKLDSDLYNLTLNDEVSAVYQFNSGWIDTGIYQTQDNPNTLEVDGHFLKSYDEEDGKKKDIHHYFAISDKFTDKDTLKNRVKSVLDSSLTFEVVDSFVIAGYVNKGDNSIGEYCQMRIGDLYHYDYEDSTIQVDSDIKDVNLSSIQLCSKTVTKTDEQGKEISTDYSFYELFDFHNNAVESISALSSYDIVARYRDKDSKTAQIKYIQLSSLSSTTLSGDADIKDTNKFSIEVKDIQGSDSKQIQLYNFDELKTDKNLQYTTNYEDYYTNYGAATLLKLVDDDLHDCSDEFVMRTKPDSATGKVQYSKLVVSLPPFIPGDSEASRQSKSIEFHKDDGVTSNKSGYFELYGFLQTSAQTVDVSLQFGQTTELDSDDILIRGGATDRRVLGYKKYNITLPDVDGSPTITNITNDITEILQDIGIISGDVTYLSSEISSLSEKFWVQGYSYSTCYGVSIGDSSKNLAIWTDDHLLWGDWSVQGNFASNAGNIKAWNFNTWDYSGKYTVGYSELRSDGLDVGGTIKTTGNIDCSGSLSAGGSITIGSTTLTEDKLKKLLKLLEDYPSVIDNI